MRIHSTLNTLNIICLTTPTTNSIELSRQEQHLRKETTATGQRTSMDEDEEGETWSWNLVAPGMDINMKGPTVSTHNGKEWVHINDYRRVKRTLNSYVKEKE